MECHIFNLLTGQWTHWTSLVAQTVKNLPVMRETQVQSWVGKMPWRREWQPTLVFLPGESHGQTSLAGYSPWGRKELGMTERSSLTSLWALVVKNLPAKAGDVRDVSLIPGSGRSPGGRHGNSLQYSCLENPMDRGAWQATVHRVTESDTTEAI